MPETILNSVRKSIITSLLVLIAMVLVVLVTNAQDKQVGAKFVIAPQNLSSGNGTTLGVNGELNWPIGIPDLIIMVEGGIEKETKLYVGDGYKWRYSAGVRYSPLWYGDLAPYIEGGIRGVDVHTSQYRKHGANLFFGGGVNYKNQIIGGYRYLPQDLNTFNHVRGHEFPVDFYVPLGDNIPWNVRTGFRYQRFTFDQPGVALPITYNTFRVELGFSRVIGERRK